MDGPPNLLRVDTEFMMSISEQIIFKTPARDWLPIHFLARETICSHSSALSLLKRGIGEYDRAGVPCLPAGNLRAYSCAHPAQAAPPRPLGAGFFLAGARWGPVEVGGPFFHCLPRFTRAAKPYGPREPAPSSVTRINYLQWWLLHNPRSDCMGWRGVRGLLRAVPKA